MAEINLTRDNFEREVINSDKPVLVDFWATWCGPCRMMGAIVSKIAEEADGRYIIGKVNVDEEEELSERYNVMSIPTLKFFRNGEVVKTLIGVNSEGNLLKVLNEL